MLSGQAKFRHNENKSVMQNEMLKEAWVVRAPHAQYTLARKSAQVFQTGPAPEPESSVPAVLSPPKQGSPSAL